MVIRNVSIVLRVALHILLGLLALAGGGGLYLLALLPKHGRGPELAFIGVLILLGWTSVALGTVLGVLSSSLQRLSVMAWINLGLIWIYGIYFLVEGLGSDRKTGWLVLLAHALVLLVLIPFRKRWVPALGRTLRGLVRDEAGQRASSRTFCGNLGLFMLELMAWSSLLVLGYFMWDNERTLAEMFFYEAREPVIIMMTGQALSLAALLLHQRRWKCASVAPGAWRNGLLALGFSVFLLLAAILSR